MPPLGLGIEAWAQALPAWVRQDPGVSVAILATFQPKRVRGNAEAGSVWPLSQEMRGYFRKETERCLWRRKGGSR